MGRPRKIKNEDLENQEHDTSIQIDDLQEFEVEASDEGTISEDSEPVAKKVRSKKPKATSTKGHYITNAVLLPAVIRAKQEGKITDELARMLMLITERYSRKINFVGYSFRSDMVSFALVNLVANALKFNPERSNNPFSFYTTSIKNSFLQYLAYEKGHRDIRDSLMVEEGFNPSNTFVENSKEESSGDYY
jgi:hypothetical protein